MGLTLAEVRAWQPGAMMTLGDDLTVAGKDYENNVQAALVGVIRTEADWTGSAGDAARSRANREHNAASNGAAAVLGLSKTLTSGASQLSAAKNRVLDVVDAATKAGCTVSSNGAMSYNHPKTYATQTEANAADAAAKAKIQKFEAELKDALNHAAQVDAQIASDIEADLKNVQSQANSPDYGSGGAGAATYASVVQSAYNQQQKREVNYALDHPGLANQLLPHLDPSIKKAIGSQMAHNLDAARNRHSGLYTQHAGGQPTPNAAAISKLAAQYGAYGHDPAVATSMLNTTGPKNLMADNGALAMAQRQMVPATHHTPFDPKAAAAIGELQHNLGVTLAAGTAGVTGPGMAATGTHVSSAWIHQFVQDGKKEIAVGPPAQNPALGLDQPLKMYGYQLMAPMLHSAGHAGYMMNQVGNGILGFETHYAQTHNGQEPWGSPIMQNGNAAGGDMSGVPDPLLNNDGIRLDWTQGHGAHDPAGYDPMGALLDGLHHNPSAARQFLTGHSVNITDANGQPMHNVSRIDYLMNDRHWIQDGTPCGTLANGQIGGGSDIKYLGEAFKGATMDSTPNMHVQRQIGGILQEIVHSTTNSSQAHGEGMLHALQDHQEALSKVNLVNPQLRRALGDIFAYHADDVHRTFVRMVGTPPGSDGAHFDQREMQSFLTDVAKDPVAGQHLRHAEYVACARSLSYELAKEHSMAHSPAEYQLYANNAAEDQAGAMSQVMGALTVGHNRSAYLHQLHADLANNAAAQQHASLEHMAANMLPTSKIPVVGPLLNPALNAAIDRNEMASMQHTTSATEWSNKDFSDLQRANAGLWIAKVMQAHHLPAPIWTHVENQYEQMLGQVGERNSGAS